MKHIYRIITALLLSVLCFVGVSAQEEFHSEFGILPPEIPVGSGLTAGELDSILATVDQESLPPSHRQRRAYEWIMQKYSYDPSDGTVLDASLDLEGTSLYLLDMLKEGSAGDAGFALLAHYMLDRMGFPSVILTGQLTWADGSTRPHQWNYVHYNGKWYHFDPLGEMLNPELNGFMNVDKDLKGSALKWNADAIPASAEYAVRALGCDCDF